MSQLDLFDNPRRTVEDVLEKHVDYSDLGKTQAMERDLDLLIDFINEYSETMIPLLDNYLRNRSGK
tara:strand:+ start:223 stop:420 length:198 start_codon:yes stop_codon:yes gene_type:complete